MIKTFHKKQQRPRRERARIPNEDRLLVYGAQTVFVNGLAFVADAYYGAAKPLWSAMDIGLTKGNIEYNECHLDHIFPHVKDGNDELANFQALAESTNTYGYVLKGKRYPQRPSNISEGKGARVLMHSLYAGLVCAEKVNAIDFAIAWRDFLEQFDATGKLTKMWPFWLRDVRPPHRPIAPGWDGRKIDRRAAFVGDWKMRARFARVFLRYTRPEIAERYRELWEEKLGFELA